jgi:hypothetical protein
MNAKHPGIDTANAALQIIAGGISRQQSTLPELTASIEHLGSAPKGALIEAIAYLAAQSIAYRDASDQDARLFITQVELMVQRYRERKHDRTTAQAA